jgi:DNA-binding transcriptional regulator YhcF (GntR family)
MDITEKTLKLQALELSLEDLDNIIRNMKENNYPDEQLQEYLKKRFNTWNEIHKVKNA